MQAEERRQKVLGILDRTEGISTEISVLFPEYSQQADYVTLIPEIMETCHTSLLAVSCLTLMRAFENVS